MSVALACCPLAWRCRAGCAELGCSPSRSSCCRSNPASAGASPGSCGARKAGWVQRGVQWRTSPLGQCAVDCGRPVPGFVGPPARLLIHLPLHVYYYYYYHASVTGLGLLIAWAVIIIIILLKLSLLAVILLSFSVIPYHAACARSACRPVRRMRRHLPVSAPPRTECPFCARRPGGSGALAATCPA